MVHDTDFEKQQVKEGIDAVIVDSVLKIRQGLTKNTKSNQTTELPVQPKVVLMSGVNGVVGS